MENWLYENSGKENPVHISWDIIIPQAERRILLWSLTKAAYGTNIQVTLYFPNIGNARMASCF